MANILTIEKIFCPGNTIQILFSQYIGSVKSFSATVTAFKEEGLCFATLDKDFINQLESGAEITIQYQSADGIKYLFNSFKVAHVSGESSIFARPWKINSSVQHRFCDPKVEMPWKVQSTSLRRYFRMKVDLLFYYSFDGIIYIGQVIDLSIGGLFAVVLPDPKFLLGSHLSFRLQLPNSELFELQGEIIRSQSLENTKLGVAINFMTLTSEIHDKIVKYLLQSMHEAS